MTHIITFILLIPSIFSLSIPQRDIGPLGPISTVASNAAIAAGKIIISASQTRASHSVTSTKSNQRDLLTSTDPLCEEEIKKIITEAYPEHLILGEEATGSGQEASEKALQNYLQLAKSKNTNLWIVDPLDGTTNFVHSIPMSLPSVACLTPTGKVISGCVYDPYRDECFVAEDGMGSWLNGRRIEVDKGTDKLKDSVIAMGSPPGDVSLSMSLKGINTLMPKVRTIRMFGSAALMLSWVGNGRLSGYWEYDLSSWDIAAGGIIVKEAGGIMGDIDEMGERGKFDITKRKIVATNGKVHEELRDALKEAGVILT